MHTTSIRVRRLVYGAAVAAATILSTVGAAHADEAREKGLAEQIFDAMVLDPGTRPGYRVAHAKGVVCEGTFVPSANATSISKALHFQHGPVPVTVRFSDGPANPFIADNSHDAGPRGIGVRFALPGGSLTDVEGISHNGFVVGTGEDFLALLKAAAATNPAHPHPWPIEAFFAVHPRAAKFVQETAAVPASFATQPYFSNNAFVFVNAGGVKRAGRYQFIPMERGRNLGDAEARAMPPNFLVEELRTRLTRGPVEFRLVVQLANAGDPTNDASLAWPDDRVTVDMGTIRIAAVVDDSARAEQGLVFFPTALTDGIELSDDPLPVLRTSAYAMSFARRQQSAADRRQ
jgi:catalase